MKRQRFKYATDRRGGIILAYSANSVRDYLTRLGHTGIVVEPVKRRATRGAGQPAAWKVDGRELSRACAALGVSWPVKITRTTARTRRGRWTISADDFGRRHRITADKLLDPAEASKVIIHELTHAAQAERLESYEAAVREHERNRRYPYAIRPCEVEARENAERLTFNIAVSAV